MKINIGSDVRLISNIFTPTSLLCVIQEMEGEKKKGGVYEGKIED